MHVCPFNNPFVGKRARRPARDAGCSTPSQSQAYPRTTQARVPPQKSASDFVSQKIRAAEDPEFERFYTKRSVTGCASQRACPSPPTHLCRQRRGQRQHARHLRRRRALLRKHVQKLAAVHVHRGAPAPLVQRVLRGAAEGAEASVSERW